MVQYTITALTDRGGWCSPMAQAIEAGTNATINMISTSGFQLFKLIDNDIEKQCSNPYIIPNVQSDHTVKIYTKALNGILIAQIGYAMLEPRKFLLFDMSAFGTSGRPYTWRWYISNNTNFNQTFTTQNVIFTFPTSGTYNINFWCRNDLSQSSTTIQLEVA